MSDWTDRRTTFWNRQKDRRVLLTKQLSYPLHTRNFSLLWYFYFSGVRRYLQLYKSVSNNQIRWCCSISLWIQPVYCPTHCNNQERIQISEENSISDYFAGYQPQQGFYCVLQQKANRRQRLQMCPGSLYQKTFKNHLSSFKYRTDIRSRFTDITIHTTYLINSAFFERSICRAIKSIIIHIFSRYILLLTKIQFF